MPWRSVRQDIAFLQYTGGTTGVSKAAILTHRNMVANVLQASAWIRPALDSSASRVVITALPLYHIFSLTANCLLFVRLGAENVLIANPRDFPAFVAELKKYKFFFISGVNTLFNALLHTPGFESLDFSALRITLGGGMAVQAVVAERWKKVTGNILTQAWGLTETSPAACINPIGLDFNGSIGLPIPSTDVSIRDDAGVELKTNEVGEICVFGPQLMRGYWNRPEETEMVMFGDWLRTGDIGRMDAQGFVFIEDRKKDMILVSGFNVYPNEIESVIATHPGSARGRGGGGARRGFRRGRVDLRGEERPRTHRGGADRVRAPRLDAVQGSEACVFPPGIAENQRRQDSAPGATRGAEERGTGRHSGRAPRPPPRAGRAAESSAGHVAAHRLDEHRDALGIDVRRDAVPQIEHVAGSRPEALEHPQGLGAQSFRGREQG